MRKICTLMVALLGWQAAFAQFSTDKLQLRLGYNAHNAHAKHFNHLVTTFNNDRYPHIISENLPSVNFQHGVVAGASYAFSEDLHFHAVFKSRRQYIETGYTNLDMYRGYLFRNHTLELGAAIPIGNEGRVRHFVGGGVLIGIMGVFTDWDSESGYEGSREMLNIDHTESIGLSIHYEAQIVLHDNFHIFIRPVAQYGINSNVRNLNQFFNPVVTENGVLYPEGEGEKYDRGNLNGIGIEGGLLILLPEF